MVEGLKVQGWIANFMWRWTNGPYLPTNLKMLTSKPGEFRSSGTATRGFINYINKYEERKATNREP
jgi:hypothetical protein